eukprot:6369514-Pyramimonas_sp.AAC.1
MVGEGVGGKYLWAHPHSCPLLLLLFLFVFNIIFRSSPSANFTTNQKGSTDKGTTLGTRLTVEPQGRPKSEDSPSFPNRLAPHPPTRRPQQHHNNNNNDGI